MPTVKSIMEDGERFCCESCGHIMELENTYTTEEVESIAIECVTCDESYTFDTFGEEMPRKLMSVGEHTVGRNDDGTPICFDCEQTSPLAAEIDENVMSPIVLIHTVAVLKRIECTKSLTERFK